MQYNTYLSVRMKEVFLDGRWIANTNYKETLAQVTFEQATLKIGELNTIASLVFHVNYYLDGLLRVLDGGPLDIHDKYSFAVPEIDNEYDWQIQVQTLLNNAEMFSVKVAHMEDSKLEQPFVKAEYGTYLRNIEALIEHSYYHLGQISLLRKLSTQQ